MCSSDLIDLDDGEQTKLNVRRALKMSAAGAAWLKVAGERDLSNLKRRRAAMVKRTGVVWPKNCHRHSFCSYSLELNGAKETARRANHSEATLFTHYANKVTRKEARKFFGLRPEKESGKRKAKSGKNVSHGDARGGVGVGGAGCGRR